MPVHHAVKFRDLNFYKSAMAGTASALTGLRLVHRAMGRANQKLTGMVKKPVGLEIHFHGHMAAAVEVGVHLAFKTDRKRTTCKAHVEHIKRHGQTGVT